MIPEPLIRGSVLHYTIEHGYSREGATKAREPLAGERPIGNFLLPPFQRESVWTPSQKKKFIESIWLNLPIGCYVLNQDDQHEAGYPCDNWLLDGQQRWTAILEYTASKFQVFNLWYGELLEKNRRRFDNHGFPAIVTRNMTSAECQDVYERLAYGGTAHEPKKAKARK